MFYSNLSKRIISILTMHTPAGTLYKADTRLRPQGNSGTIVSHIESFENYMKTSAWTWEHQALIKARPVAGDKELCAKFNDIRKVVLTKKRNTPALRKEVKDMREKMRQKRFKYKKDFFDLKQSKGGIVDIEFLVQYLILKNANAFPDLIVLTDNISLLESLEARQIITKKESENLQNAYLIMRKTIHRLNLQEKNPELSCTHHIAKQSECVISIYDKYLTDSGE